MARTVDPNNLSNRMTPSKGGWAVRVMIDGNRETFWSPTKTDLKEKVKKELDRAHDLRRGVASDEDRPDTYDGICDRRLETYRRRASSKAAFATNLNASRKKFGRYRPDQITVYKIDVWVDELIERGLSPVTICNYLDDMERAIEYARDNDWHRGPNPVRAVTRPTVTFKPNPWESWHDVFAIARAFETIGFPVGGKITRFAAGLGLRPQEVVVARECDLDRTAGTFYVQRTWDRETRLEVELTKNTASRANLNLTSMAAEVINEIPPAIHRDPNEWQLSPLLFGRPGGERISTDYFREKWAEALATLSHLPYKPPKSLRDTFATLTLLELGLDQMSVVSTLMRHTSETVTRRHYAEIVQELRLRAAADASAGMPKYA